MAEFVRAELMNEQPMIMGAIILIGIVLMIYGGAPTILERRRPYKALLNLWQYLDSVDTRLVF